MGAPGAFRPGDRRRPAPVHALDAHRGHHRTSPPGCTEFDKPTLIAWSADDVFFELSDGERLAATIPNARLEVIDGARTFSMVDRPDRLADLLSSIAVRA